jgi:hypothetical protein
MIPDVESTVCDVKMKSEVSEVTTYKITCEKFSQVISTRSETNGIKTHHGALPQSQLGAAQFPSPDG